MKADFHEQASALTNALHLSLPPIGVAFRDAAPEGVALYEGVVPAGCAFWEEAATRTFATVARDHALCAIGVHTHRLSDAPASQSEELRTSLEAMTGLDYVREDEVAAIPVMPRESKYAVYGPLAGFPVAPEAVLLFAHAGQGLVLGEAIARVDGGLPAAMGRPACAVVPQVLNQGRAAMSLGCCGARAYLDAMSESVALWALPGSRLDGYCEQIRVFARANETLGVFHRRRGEDVGAGGRPSVQESLARL